MSEDDLLRRASRALRETGQAPPSDVAMTRARVLDTLRRGERRGRRLVWLVLPIAAVLAASTALAKEGLGLRSVWHGFAAAIGIIDRAPEQPRVAPHQEMPAVTRAPATVSPPDDPAPLRGGNPDESSRPPNLPSDEAAPGPGSASRIALPRDDQRPRARPSVASSTAVPRGPVEEPEPAPAPAEDLRASGSTLGDGEAAALALYKRAHQLHFVEQRYAAAIAVWDEYLRTVPDGRLVVEARYNRAIALLRLDRRGEAAAALEPFARGEIGHGYRMREAAALLEALRGPNR